MWQRPMARVLIVEDELRYQDTLSGSLKREGHDVATAETAVEAIEIGTRFKPDVLVVDWMLPGRADGLQVCEALELFTPSVRSILITGLPPAELRARAAALPVVAFLEKPFELEDLHDAVARTAAAKRQSDYHGLGFFELGPSGAIIYRNPSAQALFDVSGRSSSPSKIKELLPASALKMLDAAATQWIAVAPLAAPHLHWKLRSAATQNGSRVFAVCRQGEESWHADPRVRMLLRID